MGRGIHDVDGAGGCRGVVGGSDADAPIGQLENCQSDDEWSDSSHDQQDNFAGSRGQLLSHDCSQISACNRRSAPERVGSAARWLGIPDTRAGQIWRSKPKKAAGAISSSQIGSRPPVQVLGREDIRFKLGGTPRHRVVFWRRTHQSMR